LKEQHPVLTNSLSEAKAANERRRLALLPAFLALTACPANKTLLEAEVESAADILAVIAVSDGDENSLRYEDGMYRDHVLLFKRAEGADRKKRDGTFHFSVVVKPETTITCRETDYFIGGSYYQKLTIKDGKCMLLEERVSGS